MTYEAMVPDLREAMAVGGTKDQLIENGLRRNARFLLRNYNFPESVTLATSANLADQATGVALATSVGKIKGVRLRLNSEDPILYKILTRREETVLPAFEGPMYYVRTGTHLLFDAPLDVESGETYQLQYWYQTISDVTAETWLTSTYADALFHRTCYEMCPQFRKPEALQTFAPLWQESQAGLAIYLNEVEWEGMNLRMGNDEPRTVADRYAANN